MFRRVLSPLARRWSWMETLIATQERFTEVHGSALAASITLAAFMSLFPLLLVVVAIVGLFTESAPDLPARVISRFGLSGEAATAMVSAMDAAEKSKRVAAPIGLVGLLWSGLGLIAALQFGLDAVWQVAGRGIKDKLVGLAWLIGAGILFVGSAVLVAVINFLPGPIAPLVIVAGLAVDVVVWLWTFKLLTNRAVGWKALVPGAVLGSVGLAALKIVGTVYVPRAVASSSALYGSIGTVFAILAWLFLFGRLVIYAASLNVVRWEEEHGTVTAEIAVPNVAGDVTLQTTRSGEAVAVPAES